MKNQPFNPFYAEDEQIRREAFLRLVKMTVVALLLGLCAVPFVMPWPSPSDAKTPPQLESR